jgi:hypothetical protein
MDLLALRFGQIGEGECVHPAVRLRIPVTHGSGVLLLGCSQVTERLQGFASLVGEASLRWTAQRGPLGCLRGAGATDELLSLGQRCERLPRRFAGCVGTRRGEPE